MIINLLNSQIYAPSICTIINIFNSNKFQAQEPSNEITATVTRYTVINDLNFTFFDSYGNAVNQLKNWEMTITLIGHEKTVLKKMKILSGNVTIALPLNNVFSEDETEKNSVAELQISSYYKFKGSVTYLTEGFIKLKRVRLNTVSSIEICVIKAGKSNKRKKLGSSDGAREDGDGSDGEYYVHQSE